MVRWLTSLFRRVSNLVEAVVAVCHEQVPAVVDELVGVGHQGRLGAKEFCAHALAS